MDLSTLGSMADTQKEAFRGYLEKAGVIDIVTKGNWLDEDIEHCL